MNANLCAAYAQIYIYNRGYSVYIQSIIQFCMYILGNVYSAHGINFVISIKSTYYKCATLFFSQKSALNFSTLIGYPQGIDIGPGFQKNSNKKKN